MHSDAQVQAVKAERAKISGCADDLFEEETRHGFGAGDTQQGEKRQVVVSCRMIACGDAAGTVRALRSMIFFGSLGAQRPCGCSRNCPSSGRRRAAKWHVLVGMCNTVSFLNCVITDSFVLCLHF